MMQRGEGPIAAVSPAQGHSAGQEKVRLSPQVNVSLLCILYGGLGQMQVEGKYFESMHRGIRGRARQYRRVGEGLALS